MSLLLTGFQDLNDIASQRSRAALGQWASQKPCQVASLACVILEQLPRSPAAVDLLENFGERPGYYWGAIVPSDE
jgi:hypothetical protein